MSGVEIEKSIKEKSQRFDPYQFRKDFPILNESFPSAAGEGKSISLIYFDNASTTQKPRRVIETLISYYEHQNSNVHRAVHKLGERATNAYEGSRKRIAEFINAGSEKEIIFTRGTTEAINLVAASWGRKFLKKGDEILLTEMEHHSNLIPWQLLAKEKGIRLRFIPFLEDVTLDLSNIETLLNEHTQLVAIAHTSNAFGTINPVKEIIKSAHRREIPVLLDAAQSVPHLPIDVQELDCDFLTFSGHKMCGPTGIGVLYAKEKWLEEMDPYQGGGEMILAVWLDKATWNELPHKFEAGTPNIAGAAGLTAAVDYLSEIGMENIIRYEKKITSYALSKMVEIEGISIFGNAPERGGIISFCLDNIHPHDIAQFLDYEGIAVRAGHHCAQPAMRKLGISGTTRASFYFYNTFEEVDRFIESLYKVKEFFSKGT